MSPQWSDIGLQTRWKCCFARLWLDGDSMGDHKKSDVDDDEDDVSP